jgi:GGDEF domain-containing protein
VKALKKKLDISDDFYRLSGDEFVILYDGVNVESLCCELKHLAFGNEDYKMSFQGLSVGCSFFPADGTSLSVLLNKADLNMYQEKKKKHRAELLAIDEKSPITDQN